MSGDVIKRIIKYNNKNYNSQHILRALEYVSGADLHPLFQSVFPTNL